MKPTWSKGGVELYLGDALEVLPSLPAGSVDCVITDPPYLKQYLPLYGALAASLPRLLPRGGSLLSIVPHYAMPTVLADVGAHLKYRWTMCMWQADGSHPRMAMGIEVLWKPVVWWINEAWPQGRGYVRDGFVNQHDGKALHKWQQGLSWAAYCLRVAGGNGVVCDPFMGSATTIEAAIRLGRKAIGIELDAHYFWDVAVPRVERALAERRESLHFEERKA